MAIKSKLQITNYKKKPDIRYLNDIKDVLYDTEWAKTAPNLELYYMYRGIEEKGELRYDITIIPPQMLGKEFVKTKGHEHLGKYGEVYLVLEGQAIYLMQKRKENIIEDVYAVKAKREEVVVIPPFYGHVTINPSSSKNLKMANWISKNCKSDYSLFEELQGACYYYTTKGWVKNEKYANVPKIRFEKPLKAVPKNLDFLKIG